MAALDAVGLRRSGLSRERVDMGLSIRVDSETDGYEYTLRAWNERFTATANLTARGQLWQLAACIAGFPAKPGDERSFVFGERGPTYPFGFCSLHFRSTASSGRAVVDVAIEANQRGVSTAKAKAEFSIPVQAADIDRFVAALHAMEVGNADEAGW